MRFDLITIFPEFFVGPLDHGIVRRAKEAGIAQIHVQDLREFTKDRHRTVDDRPFGGGEGMVLKPEPLFEAVEKLLGHGVGDAETRVAPEPGTAVLLMSAAGTLVHATDGAAVRQAGAANPDLRAVRRRRRTRGGTPGDGRNLRG